MGAKSQRKGRAAELELSRIFQGHGYNVEPGRPSRRILPPLPLAVDGLHDIDGLAEAIP